jgi:Protein of unknown function (DUF2934)
MIDPKSDIPSKPATTEAEVLLESAVRARAYQLYEHGGRIQGRAERDWLRAEADLRNRNQQR